MPGTEYQFRLRAFSNGSWQTKEESIVSSPFKTICSPPDAPPACPRTRQLASDPLVLGGLTDTGALLSAKTDEVSCTGTTSDSGGGSGGVVVKTSSGVGRRAAGAAAAAASAAAIGRGKAQAQAEWNTGGGMPGLGGVIKSGHNDDDDRDDGRSGHNDDRTDVGRGRVNRMCYNVDFNDEGKLDEVDDDVESRKRRNSDWRRGGQRERRRESYKEEEEEEQQTQEARIGHKHTRRRQLSDHESQGPGQPILLPALSDKIEHGGDRREEEKDEQTNADVEEGRHTVVEAELDAKGSTTIVLEWDSGCTNGAITTNYEVSDKT